MEVLTDGKRPISSSARDALADFERAEDLESLFRHDAVAFRTRRGRRSLWIVATVNGRDVLSLRTNLAGGELASVRCEMDGEAYVYEYISPLGAWRTRIERCATRTATIRSVTSLLPASDIAVSASPADVYAFGAEHGTVHTAQRGARSGVVWASSLEQAPFSLFYFQDFSSLNEYCSRTETSPADTIAARWPELGYAPPVKDGAVIPKSVELILSDAYLTITPGAPDGDAEAAEMYLDRLADIYLVLPRPEITYRNWPIRAEQALSDLSLSPKCTYVRDGQRFLMPYVGDEKKPPESMVQLTLAVNAGEYERWRGTPSAFAATMRASVSRFFDEDVESLVRWLPGADFGESQAEENMNHDAMDSWYLHHALFNAFRLADEGDARARDAFRRSLPFVIRVARRFAYRWPIFFNLRNLEIIRAEAAPGRGGETDVGGLYALVMLHAYDMFGDDEYLVEAKAGVGSLRGLGFTLGYQLNTTGFAAEAALRLWKLTGEREYLDLSTICLANIFDNVSLWKCDYGHAQAYRPFFGLYPLRDAPYMAPYEELEAQGKFHDYMDMAGDDLRPSLRVLCAEWQKYCLDRAWSYYPDTLPWDAIATSPRNGSIERALSVPLEDLQDGWETSGQVGQELYGAGLPFVLTSRHYRRVPLNDVMVYCNYPMYDFTLDDRDPSHVILRVGGDARCVCEIRVIPATSETRPVAVEVTATGEDGKRTLGGTLTVEGHAAFVLRGACRVDVRFEEPAGGPNSVTIGTVRPYDR